MSGEAHKQKQAWNKFQLRSLRNESNFNSFITQTTLLFYLGENGEIRCLSLAQLTVGGGTLWTSHGRTASSPSIADILIGSAELPAPPALDLGRTVDTGERAPSQRNCWTRGVDGGWNLVCSWSVIAASSVTRVYHKR